MPCDLARPLDAPENADVRQLAATLDVVLVSRTLSEVPESGWAPFVDSLWAALPPSALLFVKDTDDVEAEVVRRLDSADAFRVLGVRGAFLYRDAG